MRLVNKKEGEVKYIMKLRGITLDARNAKRIQFEKFKKMIQKFDEEQTVVCDYHRFGPTKESHILSRLIKKKYKPVQNKGLISKSKGFKIYPFGFK